MTDYPTDVHGPASAARTQTERYARCKVCGCQWQIQSNKNEDARACNFCGAGEEAISILSEKAEYGGAKRYGI